MGTSLEFLGIARKANGLAIGEEPCSAAAAGKRARLMLSASDASDNSKRNAARLARTACIPHIIYRFTKDEIGGMVGRGSPGMLAFTDIGLAAGFVSRLSAEEPGTYDEVCGLMEAKARRAEERRREARAHLKNVRAGKRRRK